MGPNRRHRFAAAVSATILLCLAPSAAQGQARETAGVITEIKVGKGKAEVKPTGGDWRPAGPLLALRAGDEVRATENASVVVLLSGGRGTVKIEAKNSPFVVTLPQAGEGKIQKAQTLVAGSLRFLSSGPKESPKAVLSTRAVAKPPVILTPRNSPVLPDSLAFEWLGNQFSRYTVRIVGPAGVVLERKGVAGGRFDYPADAPRLTPGIRYTLEVLSASHPPQATQFEVLDAGRAHAIRQELAALEEAFGPNAPANSLVVLRAGHLASAGLIHDARLLVTAALAKDPDEPTLHALLGNLYLKAGLDEHAAESFDEAQFLLTGGAN